MEREAKFRDLVGKTLFSAKKVNDSRVEFESAEGDKYALYHSQECCESVFVESIVGDLADLIGEPITLAEEATSDKHPDNYKSDGYDESFTWTFYKIATRKGYVDIRWLGSSTGDYSESVDFVKVTA